VAIEHNAKRATQSRPRNGRLLIPNDGIPICVLGDLRTRIKPQRISRIGAIGIGNACTNNFTEEEFAFKKVQFT
jgi:hypothetical protein